MVRKQHCHGQRYAQALGYARNTERDGGKLGSTRPAFKSILSNSPSIGRLLFCFHVCLALTLALFSNILGKLRRNRYLKAQVSIGGGEKRAQEMTELEPGDSLAIKALAIQAASVRTRVWIPRTQGNASWVWWLTCNSVLRRQRLGSRSKPSN